MLSSVQRGAPGPHRSFLIWHALVLPLCLVALATWLRGSGWDERLSTLFYDARAQHFLVGSDGWIELLGHRVAKSVVLSIWLLLLAAALASSLLPLPQAWLRHRSVLWATVLAMGLGPAVVTGLKDINSHVCPWSLTRFGGAATYSAHWFVPLAEAGRCFPGGHAAGGFSLVALMFAGRVLQRPRLERRGLWLALGAGGLFSGVRLIQGAHFLSHNLWSAAIDWWAASLVFAPLLLMKAPPASGTHPDAGSLAQGGAR